MISKDEEQIGDLSWMITILLVLPKSSDSVSVLVHVSVYVSTVMGDPMIPTMSTQGKYSFATPSSLSVNQSAVGVKGRTGPK